MGFVPAGAGAAVRSVVATSEEGGIAKEVEGISVVHV
jgi:hypothetical protein